MAKKGTIVFSLPALMVFALLITQGCLKEVNVQRALGQIANEASGGATSGAGGSVTGPVASGGGGGAAGALAGLAPIYNTTMVFSGTPIAGDAPTDTRTSFAVGDPIYGMVMMSDTFRNITKGQVSKNASQIKNIEIKIWVDGAYKQSMNLHVNKDGFDVSRFPMDIAPAPDKMTAFTDPRFEWGKSFSKPTGPVLLSEALGELSPGKHRVKVEVYNYATLAEGQFDITGDDYGFYARLSEQLAEGATVANRMEPARMKDATLERKMKKIAQSKGYNVLDVRIIDPDWWVERHKISGAILWRHIATQVAYKKGGDCHFRKIRFKEPYSGGRYRALEFMSEFDEYKLPCDQVKQ